MMNTTTGNGTPELVPVFTEQKPVYFPAGSILFHEGEKAEGAYFILTGEVGTSMESAEKGHLPLARTQPPAYLALVDSIGGEQYSCTGRALHDTRGLFIPRDMVMSTIATPGANFGLLKALALEVTGSYEELRTVRDKFCGRSAARKRVN